MKIVLITVRESKRSISLWSKFIWQNEILTNDLCQRLRRFAVLGASKENVAIVDAQDVRNWMLKSRDGANLNALEFRNFLINRSIRDQVQSAICILNISCHVRQPRGIKCVNSTTFILLQLRKCLFCNRYREWQFQKKRTFPYFLHLLPQYYLSIDLNRCLSARGTLRLPRNKFCHAWSCVRFICRGERWHERGRSTGHQKAM